MKTLLVVENECLNEPCQNNGVCQDLALSYVCACLQPWKGTNCDIDSQAATLSPCKTPLFLLLFIAYTLKIVFV
ncbi:EYS-like protein [Mya arenaria]|uniref:EYS-like protein n=1 Tax=Mya arenaria TaxID=6604 RepID=A0ABY7FLW4_MYAAR|nr:EYS-like protein [Mya arenaria]